MLIKVAQHLYGNVEKDSSPTGVGGFQTLGYSKNPLRNQDVGEMEGRVTYYASESSQPDKLLFFSLSSGKFVVSRVVPQQDLDRFGRRGNYLAHSFAFTSEDFSLLGCNPFIAFRLLEKEFTTTIEDAVNTVIPGPNNLPELGLDVSKQAIESVESSFLMELHRWEEDELKKLAHYALIAARLKAERTSIAIVGLTSQAENVLKVAFAFIPDALRGECSFDTYAYGCNPVASYFWARGYPSLADAPRQFLIIDAAERQVRTDLISPNSAYERWLFERISTRNLQSITTNKSIALELGRFIQNDTYSPKVLREAPESLVNDFFHENWSIVGSKVESSLTEAFGPALAPRLMTWASSRFRYRSGSNLLHILLDGFAPGDVEEWLFEVFKTEKPTTPEVAALEKLTSKSRHPGLSALLSFWRRDHKRLTDNLRLLPQAEYEQLAKILLQEHEVPVADLLTKEHPERLIKAFVNIALDEPRLRSQVVDVSKTLASMRQWSLLSELVPLISEIDAGQAKSLLGSFRNYGNKVPSIFQEAVEGRLLQLQDTVDEFGKPHKGGLLGFVKRKPR